MPKLAVARAARERKINIANPSPDDIYRLACYLGVGYETLLTHASQGIELLPSEVADKLKRTTPQRIRENILGGATTGELILVDKLWGPYRPIDVVVGDHLVLPAGSIVEGKVLKRVGTVLLGDLYKPITPGIGRLESEEWSSFVRVERDCFRGMGRFRHMEECDEE
jgi:hypothetical protein